MALEQTGTAPYAPTRAIVAVIDQYRDRGIPTPITTQSLQRLGIEPSLTQRTLAALKQLDLLEADGEPSPTLRKFKTAPSDELQIVLGEWVREAYKPIFAYVTPGDDVQRVADQFRHYDPAGQRNRMVTLFLGLCAKAGLIDEVPPLPRSGRENKGPASSQPPQRRVRKVNRNPAPDETDHRQHEPKPDSELSSARQRYVDLLLAKAGEQDAIDPDLLDRIERALGISESKANEP
jgi:hypothetical protein